MKDSDRLHPVHVAIHAFEDAVKCHEHLSLTETEIARRQRVDRAREALVDAIIKVMKGEEATA